MPHPLCDVTHPLGGVPRVVPNSKENIESIYCMKYKNNVGDATFMVNAHMYMLTYRGYPLLLLCTIMG